MPPARGEAESRFVHLLQPIRDLTKNWEVDVAAQLSEYLEELEHVCISFDNGKTTMNFTEAALLIQGSACVYSRKELPDPWQSLDPFGDSEDKPFRKGRPFLVPPGLEDMVGGKRKRKSPRKLQNFMKWFSIAYNNVPDSRRAKRNGPTFADLEVLYWKQLKERVAAQRKLQPREPLQPEEEPELLEEERGAEDEDEGDFGEHEDMEALEMLEEGAPDPRPSNSLCYEELVRRNVESRQALDVRGYGQALVQGCGAIGHWCSFARLMAGQPPPEVSRARYVCMCLRTLRSSSSALLPLP
ncbi:hypothetical protein AAES_40738 [Amazona aestiva]|uniref:Condensin-2 complex subunit H2 n=1 Tax=Amazona aestiva TaxID=12930 RepID=A0A0Q3RI45_AMAAE|nr:hypothetical protein AAES_40738 [Amazona aestiva]